MSSSKKQPSLIHVRLNYEEAYESKRELLSLQLELLKLIRAIKKFRILRINELKEKQKLKAQISNIIKDLRKLKLTLPELELPKILEKYGAEGEVGAEREIKELERAIEEKESGDLEYQLREIQERLKEIGK